MKRLVYSPQINAWVKTDTGVFDLSPYITGFTINRKVNAASTAELIFRNPKVDQNGESRFLFTQHKVTDADGNTHYAPMFHPMDPIVITLTRIKGYPVQVFTGYCNTTPYIQMFPGTARLTASCTLKRLLYTYWDPGLPFVIEYLSKYGWYVQDGNTINVQAETNNQGDLNDSSIGYLLYRVLQDIGGWEHDDIFIQGLPSKQISAIVNGLYADLTKEAKASFNQMKSFLEKTIGADHHLGGGGDGAASTPTDPNPNSTGDPNGNGTGHQTYNKEQLKALWIANGGAANHANMAAAIALAESGGSSDEVSGPNSDGHNSYDVGLWQINSYWHSEYFPNGSYDNMKTPNKNCKAAIHISNNGTSWSQWSTYNNGAYQQYL